MQDVEVICTCPRQDDMSEVCWRSHPQELSSSSSSGSTNLTGILGVVVVLDEVELDVVLGIHLTMALGASSNE